jgi:hypothetical protein
VRWVQRDESGKVIGHFANPQPYAREELPDDHPDLKHYRDERQRLEDEGRRESSIPAILARLSALEQRVVELEKSK